jgi:prophage regulatory protein
MEHQENRIIRRPEVRQFTGLTDSALDREVRAGRFPSPLKLSPDPKARAVGWSLRAVQAWIADRERDAEQVAA